MKAETLAGRLLDWFAIEARDLPWRRTRDPYAIWVSEIMLQQTQVKTVIPYWERWMRELPDLGALAAASEARVLKLWEGLGYYRRARHLHAAAKEVMGEHGGRFPSDPADILSLPGIGRYTAGAIASIAFGLPEPILDGNVVRVLSRLDAMPGDPRQPARQRRLWERARELVRAASATGRREACSHLNQALMELGALVCLPREARCAECPVSMGCRARAAGKAEDYPQTEARPDATTREFVTIVWEADGRFLVRQRAAGAVNGGLWEFPNVEVSPGAEDPESVVRRWVEEWWLSGRPAGAVRGKARRGGRAAPGGDGVEVRPWGEVRHSITRYRIRQRVFRVVREGGRVDGKAGGGRGGGWRTLEELEALAFGAAHRRLVKRLRAENAAAGVEAGE